jgi:hypothetical protein
MRDDDFFLRRPRQKEDDVLGHELRAAMVIVMDDVAEPLDPDDFLDARFFLEFAVSSFVFGFALFDVAFGEIEMTAGIMEEQVFSLVLELPEDNDPG